MRLLLSQNTTSTILIQNDRVFCFSSPFYHGFPTYAETIGSVVYATEMFGCFYLTYHC